MIEKFRALGNIPCPLMASYTHGYKIALPFVFQLLLL
jgi:hypothetical protein